MKVAVFTSTDEVIVLAVKGRGKSVEDVDGYDQWFGEKTGRDVTDFEVKLCHIGAGSGVYVTTRIKTDWLSNEVDIDHWFCEEPEIVSVVSAVPATT